jgi:ribosome-binding factor A
VQQQEMTRFFMQVEAKTNEVIEQINAQRIYKLLPEQIRQQLTMEHEQSVKDRKQQQTTNVTKIEVVKQSIQQVYVGPAVVTAANWSVNKIIKDVTA